MINKPYFSDDFVKAVSHIAINDLSFYLHSASKHAGWWDGVDLEDDTLRHYVVATKLALIHSEVSEALEGYRRGKSDDHLPHRQMIEVELADVLIRVFDLAGALGLDLGGAVMEKWRYNTEREDHKLEARAQSGGKKV